MNLRKIRIYMELAAVAQIALALTLVSGFVNADFSQREDVRVWLAAQDALGYSDEQVLSILSQAQLQPQLLPKPQKPSSAKQWQGKKPVYARYERRLLSASRLAASGCFINEHAEALARASTKFGVEEAVLAAIIGIETHFGSYVGKHRVIDTLATLAFEHPTRKKLFQRELALFLRVSHTNGMDALAQFGSSTGALGLAQFMPFSYHHYAIDGDMDGKVQLPTSIDDNLVSIANYLVAHKWRLGAPVMDFVTVASHADKVQKHIVGKAKSGGYSLLTWQSFGLEIPPDFVQQDMAATSGKGLYRVYEYGTHATPEYVLAGDNFYAITRYNHSLWYARVVATLASFIENQSVQGGTPCT